MQTSDQSSEKPLGVEPGSGSEPPPQDMGAPSVSAPDAPAATSIDHEAIRQGRIYPPPPSFYQEAGYQEAERLADPQASPPRIRVAQQQPAENPYAYNGQTEYVPLPPAVKTSGPSTTPTPSTPSYPPYGAAPHPYPPRQGYPAPPPYVIAPKKSYKWVWIVASIVGVIIFASCGVCAWASSSIFGSAFQQATTVVYGGRDLTNNYYEAVQNKRYSQAYNYLDPQGELKGLTQAQYIQQAQSLDEQYGPVYKYVAGTPSVSYDTSGTSIDHFSIPVDITRAKKSYQVLLTMYKVRDQWKITNYTTI